MGNVNIAAVRYLKMGEGRRFTTSPLYATMAYGVPAAIAAKLSHPDRQVWSLSGDGGFAMNMQDLVIQVVEKLPIINIVFTNKTLGYIESEQYDTHQPYTGVYLADVDFATVAKAMGLNGYTVRTRQEFDEVLVEVRGRQEPVVIDVKITDDRLLPVEQFPLRASDRPDFTEFRAQYRAEELEPFADILARHDVALSW